MLGILYLLAAAKGFLCVGGEDVHGLINQSVVLTLPVWSLTVQQAYWNFRTNTMASYINGQLDILMDEFEGRLEVLDNGTSLRIGQLRLEDGGLYSATIKSGEKTKHTGSFNLSVYEPVPVPSIRILEKEKNLDWCNVTLQCYVPTNKSSLSYRWKYRLRDSDHQPYDKSGDIIYTSMVIDDSWDMEFICIVENPADRKNVSVQKVCLDNGGRGRNITKGQQGRGYYAFFALVVPMAFLGWYLIQMKKKQRKALERTDSEAITYAELRRFPNQAPEEEPQRPEQTCSTSLYSTVKPGTG